MTTTIETFGVIRADGTLDLPQKLAVRPGRVKVCVEEAEVETDAEFAARFARLTAIWHAETGHHSRMDKIVGHPAYQEIIAMGERVVPLLLAGLESPQPYLWFGALHQITGANPVPKEDAGRVLKMAAAWVAWGREKGYRWERGI